MADLQDSHFVPAAMYRYATDPGSPRPNTEHVDSKGRAPVVRQVKGYLLCRDCEQLIARNGEDWMMRQVWNGRLKWFPLLERLNLAVELRPVDDALAFSSTACGIDADKLAYFALSVLWKGSVHRWRTSKDATYQLSLGQYEEPIRQYLCGTTAFPKDVSVMVTVCTDPLSRVFCLPAVAKFPLPITAFAMLALGVHFLVITDRFAPEQICCVRSPERLIMKRDCRRKTIESFAHFFPQQTNP